MKKIKFFIGCLLVLLSFLAPSITFAGNHVDKNIEKEIDEILKDFNFKTKDTDINFYSMNVNDTRDENIDIKKNDGLISIVSDEGKRKITLTENLNVVNVDQYDIAGSLSLADDNEKNFIGTDEEYINLLVSKYVSNDYDIVEVKPINDGFHQIICLKNNQYDITNYYDSYKITVDFKTHTVLGFNQFHEYIVNDLPKINSNEAIERAINYCENNNIKINYSEIPLTKLEVRKENDYFENNSLEGLNDIDLEIYADRQLERPLHCSYVVTFGDFSVLVDAYTGEIIGGDEFAATKDGASYYGSHEGTNTKYFTSSASNINSILKLLGYNSYTASAASDNGVGLRRFFRGDGNNYAFAFSGHASPKSLGNGLDKGYVRYLGLDDVYCCWKFVFLNGCSTAEDTRWRDSFGISEYSNGKIFLGWSTKVKLGTMLDFTGNLKNQVKTNPSKTFYSNLLRAIEKPGTNYDIQFWGDKYISGSV